MPYRNDVENNYIDISIGVFRQDKPILLQNVGFFKYHIISIYKKVIESFFPFH